MRRLTRYFRWPRFRRRRKVAILWPLLILLTALVAFLQLLTTDGGMAGTATPTPTTTPPAFTHPNPQSLEQATVMEIIDGDTIDVLMHGERQRVRYYGIDAPERDEKCYQEATERNRELVGTTVRLEPDARDKDEHGRLLRYVFTPEGVSVDATLVSEGLAKAWREDGRYLSRLTILETDASQHRTGCLWK